MKLALQGFWLCCPGWNTTTSTRSNSCPDGLTECLFEEVVTLNYMVYFNFFSCILLPLMVMLVIYAHIFMAARRQLRLIGLKDAHTPAPGEATSPLRASRSTLQKEVHAAKSLAIIVGLFALCWLPVHIINCFNYLCQDCKRSHIWLMNIAIILSHANSAVNPFIYAYRIREFRQTFRRILYQRILGRRDGRGTAAGISDGRGGVGNNNIMCTSSRTSKEGSLCSTVVNSYILDPSPNRTTTHEASCHWTSNLDAAPSSLIPNGHQGKSSSLSEMRQQPCIMGLAVQDGVESVENSGRGIAFVNVHALSLKHPDCVPSTDLTEVS